MGDAGIRVRRVLALALVLAAADCGAAIQDEIFGDGVDGFDLSTCDADLPSDSSDAAQYAAAVDLCKTATEQGPGWGLISAALTRASGGDAPPALSHEIRSTFGAGTTPRAGAAMAVLSTGTAAVPGEPGFTAFQPGATSGLSSPAPADWLTAHGGVFPVAPGCPTTANATAVDPVMLTLRVRVPSNARSFSLAANFLSADFPENVCGAYNDMFVALLDSAFAGAPVNPADKNLATYTASNMDIYPVGVNLAHNDTGLFTQCINGNTGCVFGTAGAISTCGGTSGLVGTGMDTADTGICGTANGMFGGGTDWLVIRGNVVPGETIQLRLAIWDTGDGLFDSLVALDNLRWSSQAVTPGTTRN